MKKKLTLLLFCYVQTVGMDVPPTVDVISLNQTDQALSDILSIDKQTDTSFFSAIPRDLIPLIIQYVITKAGCLKAGCLIVYPQESSLDFFVNCYPNDVVKALKIYNNLNYGLRYACSEGNSNLAKILIRAGANKDARGFFDETPLMHAMASGKLETTKLLLSVHADILKKIHVA